MSNKFLSGYGQSAHPDDAEHPYWESRYGRKVEPAELDEIRQNLCAFFETLMEWDRDSIDDKSNGGVHQ